MLKGIDISNYQENVDYSRVKNEGVQAAYLKASESTGYQDRLRDIHYQGLKSQGILVGFYHFFRANKDAVEQANFFVNSIKGYQMDLKPVCDVETTEGLDKVSLSNAVRTFVDKVKELLGVDCIIYTGSYFSKDNLTDILKGTQLWLAHYTTGTPSWNTDIWSNWSGWQYSSSGRVNGIFGNVDVDQFSEDLIINGVAPQMVQAQPLGQVNGANALVKNDWFFTRDSQGNQEQGHKVDIDDKIKILDVSYSKQLALVEYPVAGGTRQAYIKNVASNIEYFYQNEWQNGKSPETVYQDSSCTQPIGTIDKFEKATPLYRKDGVLHVVYSTDKGLNSKSGFVRYNGGFSKF